MTRIKICGCMRVDDALAAKEAGADFVGLLFAPDSRRRLDIEEAQAIVDALGRPLRELEQDSPPPLTTGPEGDVAAWFRHGADALDRLLARKRPLTVGVFEHQSMEEINTIADEAGIDLIQLSDRPSTPWADGLLANRQVIQVVDPPSGATADDVIASMRPGAAMACLLDVSRGRGVAIDRAVAASVAARLPVWLAGGLAPDNVGAAIHDVRPWAVDVSSGVETNGVKDATKIRKFIESATEAMSSTTGRSA
jgi:phosphoribosylanthranilate isomerase